MRISVLITSILFGALALPALLFAYQSPPSPTAFVNDFAAMLSVDERNMLEEKIVTFNASSSNEFAVVTIETLSGDTIENYANKLFAEWHIGKATHDNGILILIAKSERQVRIEVGYGLEGAVPDALAHQIITKDITPQFKNGNYYKGIDAAVDDLILATQGEYLPPSVGSSSSRFWAFVGGDPFYMFVVGIFVLQWFAAILSRTKSWWLGGVIGGVTSIILYYYVTLSLLTGIGIFFLLVIIGSVFDYIVSSGYTNARASGVTPPWWTGGGGFSGGGGSGGFGGFSGGSSGGGGSSGSW